ncbi:MAG TPA: hypothetical protein VHT75_01545 [Acidimicrobiales bacterium]|jgi:hypothetical protein|nr:hypothetical protein [Acidimicrobiales bacterium]
MSETAVQEIETAPVLRRGIEVWFATFGGVGAWTVHLVYLAAAEHWTHIEHQWSWTLNACTAVTALATVVAMALAWRLFRVAGNATDSGADDAAQMKFTGTLGLLVGAINLALILLEGSYVWFLPHT